MIETKLQKGSLTIVPPEVRKELNVDDDSILQWILNKEKCIAQVSFRRTRPLSELIAIVKDDGKDSVEIKKNSTRRKNSTGYYIN